MPYHDSDLAGPAALVWLTSIIFCCYASGVCNRGMLEAFLHGVFLGPIGAVLIALYPRDPGPELAREDPGESTKLLAAIHAELKWQRSQKEKEIHHPDFTSSIPLAMYLSQRFQGSANDYLNRLPSITDPSTIAALQSVE